MKVTAKNAIKSLEVEIEQSLDIGRFLPYNQSCQFIESLEAIRKKIDGLVKTGKALRAVPLYEMFISSCYEKINEIDDSSGNLGMFFEDLFCDWIKARQKAGAPSG